MKCNLNNSKKAMFLMAAAFVSLQANVIKEAENNEEIKQITVTTEVVSENTVTHGQDTVIETVSVTVESDGTTTVTDEIEIIGDSATPVATSVEHLAAMINNGTIKSFQQLIHAAQNFPELVDIAHRFLQEKISDNMSAIRKFSTIKNPTAKKHVFVLVSAVKNKDKLWALFR